MTPSTFRVTRATAAAALALGSAGAAAFGPEAIKSILPTAGQNLWFLGLFLLAAALIGYALWQRRRLAEIDNIGIVVAATDERDGARGRALQDNARRYAATTFVTSVAPFIEQLPAERVAAVAQIDQLGDRVNELVGFAETLAPTAAQINIVPVLRNAAAFRLGLRLGKQHRKQIVIHQGGRDGTFPATRLSGLNRGAINGLEVVTTDVPGGAADRGCLLLNLQGQGAATLDRVIAACADAGVGRVVEVRSTLPALPTTQAAFEAVVQLALMAWIDHRPANAHESIAIINGPSSIALTLGAQLSRHPDGPWTPYEFDHATGRYSPL